MAVTLLQLRNRAKDRADLSSSLGQQSNIPDETWNDYINASYGEMHELVIRKDTGLFLTSSTTQVTAGNNTIPLATSGVILKGVDRSLDGSGTEMAYVDVPRLNFRDRNMGNNNFYLAIYPGIPWVRYDMRGNNIWLTPAANAAALYRVWYYPAAIVLVSDTDTIDDDNHTWYEYVTVDAAIKALVKQERHDTAALLLQEKQILRERIESMGSDRDYGEPKQAGNRRVSTGWPAGGWGWGW